MEPADDEPALLPVLAGVEVTFVPGDPPRAGSVVVFAAHEELLAQVGAGLAQAGTEGTVDVVVPAGRAVRRRRYPARFLPLADAVPLLLGLEESPVVTPSARLWAAVTTAGVHLVSRGRLHPSVSPSGFDAWRAGPFDPADHALLADLAAAMPPLAHAVALEGPGPLRLRSPASLIGAAWDALADTFPRTAAAPAASGLRAFAAAEPRAVPELRPWLADAAAGLTSGATFSLRVQLTPGGAGRDGTDAGDDLLDDDELGDDLRGDDGALGEDRPAPAAYGVLQVASSADPSLVVDAASLFTMPAPLLSRFGADAERDLLLALRRGARAWEPIGALLAQRVPEALALDDDLLADLVVEGAAGLGSAGIAVLWPRELLFDGLALRAVMTPSPEGLTDGEFGLASLVDFHYELTLGGEALDPEEIDLLAEAKRAVVRLRGRFVAVSPEIVARARDRRTRRMGAAEAIGALLGGALEIDGDLVEVVAEGALAGMAERLRALSAGALDTIPPPSELLAELRPYQQRGLDWLASMTGLGLGGCLADDMGLGKTVQVIALHLHRTAEAEGPRTRRRRAGGSRTTTLVVCPTSLLGNWERELRRFAPSVPVRRFHGGGRHLDDLRTGEVVLTTYGIVRRERAALAEAGFSMVVADEAQHAKNPMSDTAKALRSVPAPIRLALTGTPVENRLSELWSILDWTTPGLLGPLERFRRTIAVAVERNRDPEATARLSRAVRPFLLRRRKTDPEIAPDLPERTVTDVAVPLTTEQVSLYEAEVREALRAIQAKSGIERQGLVLRLLTVLKQICNHPAQYLHQPGPLGGRSGKLSALDELLDVIVGAGDSVLVFSQFVEMCALIEAHLATLRIPTLFLHGGVPARRREEMVERFQSGAVPVFLLSLKAGGVGLNLTRATHVVHYDRWWNPAVEDQASDRAHRIGQRRAVQIHRLVCEGTLEDRIAELLEKKRDLAEAVVGGGEAWIGDLSDAELADLVRLGSDGGGR